MNTYIEELEKGRKPLPVGTIKDWKGGKYIKTATGWKPHRTGDTKEKQSSLDADKRKSIVESIAAMAADNAGGKNNHRIERNSAILRERYGDEADSMLREAMDLADKKVAASETPLKTKPGRGRPKGSKNKPKDGAEAKESKPTKKLTVGKKAEPKAEPKPKQEEPRASDDEVAQLGAPITDKKLAAELKKKVFRRSSDSGSVNELYDEYLPPSFVKGIYKLGDYYFAIHKTSANEKFLKLTNLETGLSAGTGKGVEGVIENFNKMHIQNGKLNAVVKNEIEKHAGKTYPRKDYEYSESEKKDIEKKNAKTKAYADAVKAEVEDTSPTSKTGAVRARKVTDKALIEKITNNFYQSSSIDGTKRDPVTGVLESFEVKIKIPPEKIKGVLEIGDGHYAVLAEIYSMRERAQNNKLQVNDYESGARVYQSSMEFDIRSANLPVKSSLGSVNDAIYHVNKGMQLAVSQTGITEDMYKKAINNAKERNKDAKVFESYEDFLKFKKEVGALD